MDRESPLFAALSRAPWKLAVAGRLAGWGGRDRTSKWRNQNPMNALDKINDLSEFPRRARDPATGEFGDAKVIRKFGAVPDDLSAL